MSDNETKVWRMFWPTFAIVILIVFGSLSSCEVHTRYRKAVLDSERAKIIESSADPIAMACAFDELDEITCALKAANSGQ